MKKLAIGAVIVAAIVAIASANAFKPEPNVAITWTTAVDPTSSTGVPAPLWQFLIRTDVPSLYYKSGNGNTAWTQLGAATPSPGGGITWTSGTGAPSGSCAVGSLYSNVSGGALTTLYVCTGPSTWTAK